jgi:hypothetical protein
MCSGSAFTVENILLVNMDSPHAHSGAETDDDELCQQLLF